VRKKLVVLSGAGVSAESGLATFRDSGGLWNNYSVYDVATPEAFERNPELVLEFYNMRRKDVSRTSPNEAHRAIASAEKHFDVTVVTQNVDDLHERAGSSHVLHVHGLITQARSTSTGDLIDLKGKDIILGDCCPQGGQLRPHVVWFGEMIDHMDDAAEALSKADIVLVVGTSLTVYPFAGLAYQTPINASCHLITKDIDDVPPGFEYHQGTASELVPEVLKACAEGVY